MIANLVTLLLFLFIGLSNFRPIDNTDFWFHLKTGEIVANLHFVPTQDIFSHTATGQRWVAQSWLYDTIIYYLTSLFSWNGVVAFKVLVSLLTYAILFKLLRQKGLSQLGTALLLLIMQLATVELWVDRPHILGYLLMAISFYLLERFEGNTLSRRLLFFVFALLFLLWGNLHSSVIVGLLLIGVYWTSSFLKPIWERPEPVKLSMAKIKELFLQKDSLSFVELGFVSFAFSLINPNFIYQHLYVFIVNLPYQRKILYEWKPTLTYINDWHVQLFLVFILFGLGSIVIYAFLLKKKLDVKMILLLPAFLYFAFDALRNMGNFFVLFLPLYAPIVRDLRSYITQPWLALYGRTLLFGLLICSIIAYSGIKTPFVESVHFPQSGVYWSRLPVNAANYLEGKKDVLNEKIYNPYHWGAYLLWRLYPDYKVFVDSRWDPFLKRVFEDYYRIARAEVGFEKILDEYQVDIVLLQDGQDWARWDIIGSQLELSGNWYVIFKDDLSAIFLRNSPRYQDIIDTEAYRGAIFYGEEIVARPDKIDLAKKDLQKIISASPQGASFAYNRLGVIFANEGHWEEALTHYQNALKIKPNYAAPVYNIGRIFELRDNGYEEALSYYERSVQLDKNFFLSYLRMGDIYYNKFGFRNEALKNYQMAKKLALDPKMKEQITQQILAVEQNIKIQ